MFGREKSIVIVVIAALSVLAGGCSGMIVQRQQLDVAGSLAVASVVLSPEAGERGDDRKVLQLAVDHASEQVRAALANVRHWTVQDAGEIGRGKALRSFGKPSSEELNALFPLQEVRDGAQAEVDAALASWKERFLAADGLPVVPRAAFAAGESGEQDGPAVRAVLLQQAGKLCHELGVDAVAFAQVRYEVSHPRANAFIVTEGRTDGLLSVSATLVIVDKTGEIIVDMGRRRIDERSPSKDMLPLYRGEGKSAVTAANVDLADPKKKVQRAFQELIDIAMDDLTVDLKGELQK